MRTRRPMICLLGTLAVLAGSAVQAEERPQPTRVLAQRDTLARAEAFDFAERPAWQERLDRVARHGIAFAQLRQNRDTRLVVGMHPDGYIGVFLQPRTK